MRRSFDLAPKFYYAENLVLMEEKMAYKISDACVNCGSCDSECPVEAIAEKDNARWIDPAKCQDCGACAAVCPAEAISAG
jgi:NAD-dependent dihydropyrimidine dehydrogenase PreA subunit